MPPPLIIRLIYFLAAVIGFFLPVAQACRRYFSPGAILLNRISLTFEYVFTELTSPRRLFLLSIWGGMANKRQAANCWVSIYTYIYQRRVTQEVQSTDQYMRIEAGRKKHIWGGSKQVRVRRKGKRRGGHSDILTSVFLRVVLFAKAYTI